MPPRAATDLPPIHNPGQVAYSGRDAATRCDDDALHVLNRCHDPDPLDEGGLAGLIERSSSNVGVVSLEGLRQLPQSKPVLGQVNWIDQDVDLPLVPTPGIDLGDAGY